MWLPKVLQDSPQCPPPFPIPHYLPPSLLTKLWVLQGQLLSYSLFYSQSLIMSWAHQKYLNKMQCSHGTFGTILKSEPWHYLTPTHESNTLPCPPLLKPQCPYLSGFLESSGPGLGGFLHTSSPGLLLYEETEPREITHLVNNLVQYFFHDITGFLLAEGQFQIQSRNLALALFRWFSRCQPGPVPRKLYGKQGIFYIIFQEVLCSIAELRIGWTQILLQFWESHLTS